jgi:tRNA threonylcarbamoyladenosine biosynthesis protein TsaB
MKILALDLSSARGSVAWRDGEIDLACEWPNDRKNSGAFFENLATVRREFGLPETIIVGLGPGSYAGTRIAISAAIGLSMVGGTSSVLSDQENLVGRHGGRPSKIRLVGYPSICAMESDDDYCAIGDARRNSFFLARIHDHNLVEGPDLFTEAELKTKLDKREMSIFASEKLPQFDQVELRYPSATILAKLASETNRDFAQPPLEPMYLREPHITEPRKSP